MLCGSLTAKDANGKVNLLREVDRKNEQWARCVRQGKTRDGQKIVNKERETIMRGLVVAAQGGRWRRTNRRLVG